MTYPVPTYEALKGILNSVYWQPAFLWIIKSVRIMNPIVTEQKGIRTLKYNTRDCENDNSLSYYTYLQNVHYQVQARFEWNSNRPELSADHIIGKHAGIANRMIRKGGRRDIFLGTRECQGYIEPCVFGEGTGAYDNTGTQNMGVMLHGITYADEAVREEDKLKMTVRLWEPVMKNGIIRFIRPEECTTTRHIKPMEIKHFSCRKVVNSNELGTKTISGI